MTLSVRVGDLPVEIDTSEWRALVGKQLAGAFDYEALSPPKRAVVRIGMKLLMHEVLDRFERASLAGLVNVPPPDRALADTDVLTYGASYLAAFLIAEIEKLAFVADYEEADSGAIRITGLRTAPAVAGANSFFIAGPENGPEAGDTDAEALAVGAVAQPSESEGDCGIAGRYVDAGGNEGERQDVRREATSA